MVRTKNVGGERDITISSVIQIMNYGRMTVIRILKHL